MRVSQIATNLLADSSLRVGPFPSKYLKVGLPSIVTNKVCATVHAPALLENLTPASEFALFARQAGRVSKARPHAIHVTRGNILNCREIHVRTAQQGGSRIKAGKQAWRAEHARPGTVPLSKSMEVNYV